MLGAGCSTRQTQPESVPARDPVPEAAVEPSPSDPFAAVDDALARLALLRDRRVADEGETVPGLWPRLVSRFGFAHCPDGSSAARWAAWYAGNEDYMRRVLNRAEPWLHFIANEIENRDLPGELALLPIVESAFDPFAYSHGRAAGPWQFLSATARDFGLVITDAYDGRRDFVAATAAALDYLAYLNGLFDGDWALAVAAYNAGQGRVGRAIRRNRARGLGTEWHELALPRETRAYVPKINGLGCLFRDPATYAFVLPALPDRPQVARLPIEPPVDLVRVAMASGIDHAELLTLNAGLNKHFISSEGPDYLLVSVAHAEIVEQVLESLPPTPPVEPERVRVRSGDSLSVLAQRHGTSVRALKAANGLSGDRLIAGQSLALPGHYAPPASDEESEYRRVYRELAALQQRLLPTDRFIHRVRSGESLWVIARRYGVGVRDLQAMNGLRGSTLIRPGQRLVIETDRGVAPPPTGPERYVVQRGDSLWTISRRQRVELRALMRWNGLDADSVLRPGQELIIRRGSDA
jgi:membrane-bound lytic murein transglycosylase D